MLLYDKLVPRVLICVKVEKCPPAPVIKAMQDPVLNIAICSLEMLNSSLKRQVGDRDERKAKKACVEPTCAAGGLAPQASVRLGDSCLSLLPESTSTHRSGDAGSLRAD